MAKKIYYIYSCNHTYVDGHIQYLNKEILKGDIQQIRDYLSEFSGKDLSGIKHIKWVCIKSLSGSRIDESHNWCRFEISEAHATKHINEEGYTLIDLTK